MVGDRRCGNGHQWVWCHDHHVRVALRPEVNTHAGGFPIKGCRCGFGIRLATKSDAEREDEEANRLVRPSPKKKPPRDDSRRNRVHQDDPDLGGSDKDLSKNYKDTGG